MCMIVTKIPNLMQLVLYTQLQCKFKDMISAIVWEQIKGTK